MSGASKVVGVIGPRKITQRMVQLTNMVEYSQFFTSTSNAGVKSAEHYFDWGWIIKDMDIDKETGVGWVLMEHGVV